MKEISFDADIHLPAFTSQQKDTLVECAEQLALRFCAPVFLVGSAIDNYYPNDIDIYIAVNETTYLRLFTNYNRLSESKDDHVKNIEAMKLQQAKIYRKQKEYFMERILGWDFDVKFQNYQAFSQHKGQKIRLDLAYLRIW